MEDSNSLDDNTLPLRELNSEGEPSILSDSTNGSNMALTSPSPPPISVNGDHVDVSDPKGRESHVVEKIVAAEVEHPDSRSWGRLLRSGISELPGPCETKG